jgi:uncharacterized SAM-binding protein YcdF (DUF218 family)
MLRRLASSLLLVWMLGFLWFAVFLPRPAGDVHTDSIVVLTGLRGRIDHAVQVLKTGQAPRLMVSGVDREVRPGEFAAEYRIPTPLMKCCVTLGYEAVDTRSNARESARWIAANKFRSVRLVTSDWHMRRAAFDLARVAPAGVTVVEDAVSTRPSFWDLFLEYHKLLARLAQWATGG